MTKAVVLEIKENYAAVLADDGTVRKIRNNGYAVGQNISLAADVHRSQKLVRAAAAAAAVLLVGGGSYFYAANTVFAYSTVTVSADEAEVELTLNRHDEVISAKALNDASEKAARDLQVSKRKRKALAEALTELTAEKETADIGKVISANEQKEKELLENARKMLPERQPAEQALQEEAAPIQKDEESTVNSPDTQQTTEEPLFPDMNTADDAGPESQPPAAAPEMAGKQNEKSMPVSEEAPETAREQVEQDGQVPPAAPEMTREQGEQAGQIPPAASEMTREQVEQAGQVPPAAPEMTREQGEQTGQVPPVSSEEYP